VGGYRLLRVIGEGGMGKVYEAQDAATGRRVALKLIAPQYAGSPDAVERFRREGRLASALSHPRCVFVLAADEEAGRPYIVMELMPGDTLEDLLRKQGPLPPEQALPKILDVIEGLKEAHRLGVVHRDIKPSNCFLEPDGHVKVGDFGLAKSLVSGAQLTKTGSFLGTVLFAAPEQIKGEPTGPQADVYSVATTLYCLLTGQAPFQGTDPAATLARIVCDPAPSMRTLRPELPAAIDQVVLRGLERDRARRWRDLDAFEAALRPLLPGTLSIVGLGLRFAAFVLDYFFILIPVALFELLVILLPSRSLLRGESGVNYELLVLCCWFAYFSVSEGVWARSLGKWFLGLRVAEASGGEPPGLGRALVRAGVFFVLWQGDRITQWCFVQFGVTDRLLSLWQVTLNGYALAAGGTLLLVGTMRSRNGYRGLHEWASGTRVVSPPQAEASRTLGGGGKEWTVSHPASLPERVGSFRVLGAVRADGPDTVLLGEDPALGRKVFLWLRPSAAGTPLADGRRRLSRATRPRWLASGRSGDHLWDAFLAPAGQPLADVVATAGRLSWAEGRYLLRQLAEELSAAEEDMTLPFSLTLNQVWVESDGRLQLMDVPVATDPPAPDPLTFLRDVMVLALEGKPRPADELSSSICAPVPQHAARLLARLSGCGEAYPGVSQVRAELAAMADQPAALSRGRRLAHLVVQAAFVYLALFLSVLPVIVFLPGSDFEWRWLLVVGSAEAVLWAFLWRGGLSLRLLGLSLVGTDGHPAGRRRCAWRAVLVWAPVTALLACWIGLEWQPAGWATLALLALYVILALGSPERALHDRLAGTYLVPR
jgi:hypothetical protein